MGVDGWPQSEAWAGAHAASGDMTLPATSLSKPINHVAFIFAMVAEAQHTIKRLGLAPKDEHAAHLPAQFYGGDVDGLKVTLVINGEDAAFKCDRVGTVAAALTTQALLMRTSPDLLVTAGTAGSFKALGGAIGDVFVIDKFIYHDRRIAIPGFAAYGVRPTAALPTPHLLQETGWKSGVCSTGDSLDSTAADLELMAQFKVVVKEMEAATVAEVAGLFGVPVLALKTVTDIVDDETPNHETFMANLASASQKLQDAIPELLKFVHGKEASGL